MHSMFGELAITYTASVLPPRAWTIAQSQWAVELADRLPPGPILELCTGSGSVGLIAALRSGRRLVAVDANEAAAECVVRNAFDAGIGDLVEVRCSTIDAALAVHETFPLIIADPPWVPHDDVARFPLDPPFAIDGGEDGLRVAHACVDVIDRHLRAEGVALLQLGSELQVHRLRSQLRHRVVITEQRSFPGQGELVRLERPNDLAAEAC